MGFHLAPEAARAGYGLIAHETIGSTNADALERLRVGERVPFWVVSRHQSQGRGRRGAAWKTDSDNLAASLALTTEAEPATVATLGFVAGLALVRALERCCGSKVEFRLKWPNDVLADGAKLAGILLELETMGQARAVVVGIGVNVAHAPGGLPYRTASLRGLAAEAAAEDVFRSLSAEWLDAFELWDNGRGFEAVREAWLGHAVGLGQPVSVKTGAASLSGTFETIDRHGQLMVRSAEGALRSVSAGDVYFGSAATLRAGAAG